MSTSGPPSAPSSSRLAATTTGISIAAIWLATLAAALLSPDMVSGSQQEHLPLAALLDWLWAAVASGYVLMARSATKRLDPSDSTSFLVAVIVVWVVMALASILGPELVTGTDPTRIPLVAIIAPLAAMAVTGFICLHATNLNREARD